MSETPTINPAVLCAFRGGHKWKRPKDAQFLGPCSVCGSSYNDWFMEKLRPDYYADGTRKQKVPASYEYS